MRKQFTLLTGVVLVSCFLSVALAQPRDTTRIAGVGPAGAARTGPKPYKEVITDKAISRSGNSKKYFSSTLCTLKNPERLIALSVIISL